tara:strand:- start:79 stop:684 length:606 start_codon:yes stop_codon:yes gene_type:complete
MFAFVPDAQHAQPEFVATLVSKRCGGGAAVKCGRPASKRRDSSWLTTKERKKLSDKERLHLAIALSESTRSAAPAAFGGAHGGPKVFRASAAFGGAAAETEHSLVCFQGRRDDRSTDSDGGMVDVMHHALDLISRSHQAEIAARDHANKVMSSSQHAQLEAQIETQNKQIETQSKQLTIQSDQIERLMVAMQAKVDAPAAP